MSAVAYNTMASLKARGVQFVKDDGFIDLTAVRLQREAEQQRRRNAEKLEWAQAEARREAKLNEWFKSAAAYEPTTLTADKVLRRFAKASGFTIREIKGPSRARDLILVRMAVAYWLRRRLCISYPRIGQILGGRDHTTSLHSVRSYPERRARMGVYLKPIATAQEQR